MGMRPTQGALFGDPKPSVPYVKNSPTSEAAARKVSRGKAEEDRRLILAAIRDGSWTYPGLTDDQLAQCCPSILPNALRPRRGELVKAGLIVDSGRTRKTRSGRLATIWIAT